MIDFILICFVGGVFYGGFWCGKTFQTFGAMVDRTKAAIKGWLA